MIFNFIFSLLVLQAEPQPLQLTCSEMGGYQAIEGCFPGYNSYVIWKINKLEQIYLQGERLWQIHQNDQLDR